MSKMSSKEIYNNIFMQTFSLSENQLNGDLKYNAVPDWDSIGHMTIVAELEDKFNVSMETDDIVDFSSYQKGLEILAKYGIQF